VNNGSEKGTEKKHCGRNSGCKFVCQDHVDLSLFDAAEITHREFVPIGTTVNSHYYLGVM